MAAAAPKPRSASSRWVWVAAAGVLLIVAYAVYTRRAAASGSVSDTSGTPGPNRSVDASAAQQPSGGSGSVAGNLPPFLVSAPDPVTTQVQATDTSSVESPAAITATAPPALEPAAAPAPPNIPGQPAAGTFAAETSSFITPSPVNAYGLLTTTGTTGPARIGYGRALEMPNQQSVFIDSTGHVTSPVGTRVGGRPVEVG